MKKLTREEALKAIPEGWVECGCKAWDESPATMHFDLEGGGAVYAIPKPREPIRKTTTVEFEDDGCMDMSDMGYIRECFGLTQEESAGRTFTVTVEEVME